MEIPFATGTTYLPYQKVIDFLHTQRFTSAILKVIRLPRYELGEVRYIKTDELKTALSVLETESVLKAILEFSPIMELQKEIA